MDFIGTLQNRRFWQVNAVKVGHSFGLGFRVWLPYARKPVTPPPSLKLQGLESLGLES